jgi:hypothetical protein
MRSPNYFIIKPKGGKYNNTKNIGNNEILVNDNISDGHSANREGIVVETPMAYKGNVNKGDTIIVHHNTFRQTRDMKNNLNHGKLIKDDLYWVDDYYMHIDQDGNINSKAPFVFIEPRFKEDSLTGQKEYDNAGEVIYTCPELEELDIKRGKVFAFKDGLNATYNINGKDYFRLRYTTLLAEL